MTVLITHGDQNHIFQQEKTPVQNVLEKKINFKHEMKLLPSVASFLSDF